MYNDQEKWFIAVFGWVFVFMYKVFLYVIWGVLFFISPLTIAYKNILKRYNEINLTNKTK